MNLIPKSYLENITFNKRKKRSIIVSSIVSFFLILNIIHINNLFYRKKKELNRLEGELSVLAPRLEREKLLIEEKKRLEEKDILIKKIAPKIEYSRLLEDLSLLVPKEVIINHFNIDSNGDVRIEGEATDNLQLIEMINSLNKYPLMEKVQLKSSDKSDNKIIFKLRGKLVEV